MRNISSNSAQPFARVRSLASCFKSSIIITEAVFRREAVVGICRLCSCSICFKSPGQLQLDHVDFSYNHLPFVHRVDAGGIFSFGSLFFKIITFIHVLEALLSFG